MGQLWQENEFPQLVCDCGLSHEVGLLPLIAPCLQRVEEGIERLKIARGRSSYEELSQSSSESAELWFFSKFRVWSYMCWSYPVPQKLGHLCCQPLSLDTHRELSRHLKTAQESA